MQQNNDRPRLAGGGHHSAVGPAGGPRQAPPGEAGDLKYTDPWYDEFKRSVQDDTGIKPEWAAEAFSDLDEDVRQSIARIQASPFIPRKDSVRGFVYEVETGRLREVEPAPAQSRFRREPAAEHAGT